MVDFGLPLGRVEDILEFSAPYLDLAKVATGTSRLYSEEHLRRKLDLYRSHAVRPFLGGQFQEYVFATQGEQAIPSFLDEAKRLGFEVVEVSDNTVPLSPEQRKRQIGLAVDKGLAVFGEVGSKAGDNVLDTLVAQANDALAAGAELLLVEGAELTEGGRPNRELLNGLRDRIDMDKVLFELPGPWISGVTLSEVHDLKKFLVAEFGPDINIANVMPDDIVETEALRVGLGVVGPKIK
ncbi:MAG: phosphosulfolactate synthase [Hyphomicrobiales bacterium]|nr:phosphosulfolactate synthase [Hyphomicrobiales bacterium]MCP5370981.1 phosphosulfolactate synthase [Hyphomicrobiales bacterium]